ncbi:MAG: hypothetical protein H8E32_00225 [Nitrospinae bacterium]|nr:hypothetical protein [Nitrospinota bacterium]
MSKKKPKKLKKTDYEPVVVYWIDSCEPIDNSEISINEIPQPQKIIQCGFLIIDNSEYISIAGAYKHDPNINGGTFDYVITIPKFAVTKITKLQ